MYERMTLHHLFGDLVVYRNLEPADRRLTSLKGIWPQVGLATYRIPRKVEPIYSQVILNFLRQANALRSPNQPLERLLYIGDTETSDRTAISNLSWHLPIRGFIGDEDLGQAKRVQVREDVMVANRWAALLDFLRYLEEEDFPLDEGTATLVDFDKTAFGARGRNSRPIDAARVEAVLEIAQEALRSDLQKRRFREAYDELKQLRYHSFTADNQDYLVYISLMVAGEVYDYDALLQELAAGRVERFDEFILACYHRMEGWGDTELSKMHREVWANWEKDDPTPFKSFRYREYEATLARMDALPDECDRERLLSEEIVITREVVELCRFLAQRGVLLFGLTDKPDEASSPRVEEAEKGHLPLHKVTMKVVGEPIDGAVADPI